MSGDMPGNMNFSGNTANKITDNMNGRTGPTKTLAGGIDVMLGNLASPGRLESPGGMDLPNAMSNMGNALGGLGQAFGTPLGGPRGWEGVQQGADQAQKAAQDAVQWELRQAF